PVVMQLWAAVAVTSVVQNPTTTSSSGSAGVPLFDSTARVQRWLAPQSLFLPQGPAQKARFWPLPTWPSRSRHWPLLHCPGAVRASPPAFVPELARHTNRLVGSPYETPPWVAAQAASRVQAVSPSFAPGVHMPMGAYEPLGSVAE